MKAKLYGPKGEEKGTINLPKNFLAKIRSDILAKVYETQKMIYTQPYGAKKGAGAGYSASGIVRHRRHEWKSAYGKGMSRVPRKIMSRNGSSFNWVGATVSSARGGRKPHAPKSEKNAFKKINKKELLIAYNSAFSSTLDPVSIEKKYKIKSNSGFIFSEEITKAKTKDFLETLKLLFKESYDCIIQKKSIRAGKGKLRGRKYKKNAGLLFVIGTDEKMKRNKIDVVRVSELKISDLSPNGEPGRFSCYTEKAVKEIGERFK
jgi:large subunit ribosomal protein L4e